MCEASLVEMIVLQISPYLREDRPLLWLGEKGVAAPRLLPPAIGEFEAAAIQMPLEGETPVRPVSYDLLSTMLARLNIAVGHVVIDKVVQSVFYARVVLPGVDPRQAVDSRPSDAVALALRTGAPIFVASDLLDDVGIEPVPGEPDVERSMERFHEFEPQITGMPEREAETSQTTADLGESKPRPGGQQPSDCLMQLHTQLQRAVICEDYEEAARLRDQIESREDQSAD
jgi:uncharacterized protein